ncbi:hypothetical protein HanRHA438_Chr06g0261091 [Helianthus annuus]|nr:hypothetical protein HanRHA438_Chr06g0261091 [Helianthus annuus]
MKSWQEEKYVMRKIRRNIVFIFFSKTYVNDEPQRHSPFSIETNKYEPHTYDEPVLPDTRATGLGRAAGILDNDEHKRFVREVHEEVNEAREKSV